MECEFCREDIAVNATVCPHCRKATMQGRSASRGKVLKWGAIIVGVPIGLFILLAVIGSQMPEKSVSDRIIESCKQQYSYDQQQQNLCSIALGAKYLDNKRESKINQAAHDAGVDN